MVAVMEVRPDLLVLLCLLSAGAGAAMAQSVPPSSPVAPPPRPTPFGRTMSTVITVAISVFFFLLFFCAYINQCRLAQVAAPQAAAAAAAGASRRGKRGLEPAVVATFPIMPYREIKEHKIGRGVLECAVCLTAFEDADDLRLLPHCSHAFHPDCIDPWLEARITCPLCRANLEKPPPLPSAVAPPSPEQVAIHQPSPAPSPPHAVAIDVQEEEEEDEESDEDDRKEEAMELETLRSERRAARLPRSHSTGHSLFAASAAAAERSDHERFTLRLPQHVREQVLRSRRLRHATSLIDLAGVSIDGTLRGGQRAGEGGSIGSAGGGRRWQAFLARTMSWARGGGDGSVRKGWDGSTRRGRDDAESSRKGAASPAPAARP